METNEGMIAQNKKLLIMLPLGLGIIYCMGFLDGITVFDYELGFPTAFALLLATFVYYTNYVKSEDYIEEPTPPPQPFYQPRTLEQIQRTVPTPIPQPKPPAPIPQPLPIQKPVNELTQAIQMANKIEEDRKNARKK